MGRKRAVTGVAFCALCTIYVVAALGCARGGQTIQLRSGKSVDDVNVRFHASQQYGGYPPQYSLTIRYKTQSPLESDQLRPEVTEVWNYFSPVINRRPWSTVTIEPMTFGLLGISWKGLAFVYHRTASGWTDPWVSPPTQPAFGIGDPPQ
jgi:hypothetical protein